MTIYTARCARWKRRCVQAPRAAASTSSPSNAVDLTTVPNKPGVIESVYIPTQFDSDNDRGCLCISSQVPTSFPRHIIMSRQRLLLRTLYGCSFVLGWLRIVLLVLSYRHHAQEKYAQSWGSRNCWVLLPFFLSLRNVL